MNTIERKVQLMRKDLNDKIYSVSIEELELSVRTYNCLKRAGFDTVGELLECGDDKLMHVRNLGRKSYMEIKDALYEYVMLKSREPEDRTDHRYELDRLIGLEDVKAQIRRIESYARLRKDMSPRMQSQTSMSLNMAFVGNPGTAKTTVARLLAGILANIGILTNGSIVEVGRGDLVGQYSGHTAEKVKEVFRRAKGKLLFIDEAYSLCEYWKGGYGDEAINTIVQEMENNRSDTIVVMAGYPDRMEEFFRRNPGLRSRVPFKISFSDYSPEEMVRIAECDAEKKGFVLSDEAKPKVLELCREASKDSENGNGRFCRNLIESAILDYALRVYSSDSSDIKNDFILRPSDINVTVPSVGTKKRAKPVIGFA